MVKSNVMLAFGLLTDWKEMAPFLVDKSVIDAVFLLCHRAPPAQLKHRLDPTRLQGPADPARETKENAYLALA